MANFDWSKYEEKEPAFDWSKYEEPSNDVSLQKPTNHETLGDKLIRYGVKDPLVGLANLGHGLLNAPHNLASLLSKSLGDKIPQYRPGFDYGQAVGLPEEQNLVDTAIQATPELLSALALPETKLGLAGDAIADIPRAGKYLKAALGNALSQGGFAAAMAPNEQRESAATAAGIAGPLSALAVATKSGSPALRTASKLGLIGSGAGLGYEAGKNITGNDHVGEALAALLGGLTYKGLNSKRGAQKELLDGIEKGSFEPTLNAAKRLGLKYLTPAEATGNPFLGAKEGNLGRTSKGAQLRYERGEQRLSSEQDAINQLFNTVFDREKLAPEVDRLYKAADSQIVPNHLLEPFKKNEIYKKAKQIAESEPAYKEELKNVPKNSIAYQNVIKQAIDGMISKAERNNNGNESRILNKTKNQFVNALDNASPEFKAARALAERDITRQKLENIFNKKAMTGINMYKALEDKSKFKALMNNLRNVPEAQSQLKDMRTAFKNLISAPTARTAAALSRTNMDKPRSGGQFVKEQLQKLFSGKKYDLAAIDLITNPRWSSELKELSKTTSKEEILSKFIELLSKAGAQAGADQMHKPLELELTHFNRRSP